MSAPAGSRVLNPAAHRKPLDFGADGLIGSVDAAGGLIALNTYNPRHGFVTLTAADPFPEDQRYNPDAVRRYRAGLAQLRGFGPDLAQSATPPTVRLLADAIPQVAWHTPEGAHATMIAWAGGGAACQQWTVDRPFRWRGRLSLQRCAYTQLTEGGPLPMPPLETHARFADGILSIANPALGCAVAIRGFLPDDPWERRTTGPVTLDLPGVAGTTTLVYHFGATADEARALVAAALPDPAADLARVRGAWEGRWAGIPERLAIRRGLSYGLLLSVPVGESTCILTDHMLLPLSWNRDAYYVARALLAWRPDLADVVRRHLLWMFEVAERPDGAWGRCYLANGARKDAAFQLDQQLFPLLELAEYVQITGDRATWERLRPAALAVIAMLLARKAPDPWLFATDETPADDPLALPYHCSSHVLMWHALRQIAQLTGDETLRDTADAIRRAALERFTTQLEGQTLYAYAIDGAGQSHFYHDANDFPLVLAPVWGFVPVSDPVWRATVAFGFSAQNEGGCYAGRLGSVHTRAPWPLGDIQDLLLGQLLDDSARAARAWAHLDTATQWDGALPEAVDAQTGAVVSRHWFAWPNAALACVALGAFDPGRAG